MAKQHWFVVKVRPGFAPAVAQRLRNLNFEAFVPENKTAGSRDSSQPAEHVYCRFDLQNRGAVTSIPGVLDILGTPEPTAIDEDWPSIQMASRLQI